MGTSPRTGLVTQPTQPEFLNQLQLAWGWCLVTVPLLLPSSVLTARSCSAYVLEGALSLIPETFFVVASPQSAKASQHMFSRVPLSSSVLEPMPLGDGIPSILWALYGMTCCTSVDSGTTDGGLYEFLTYFVTVTLVFDSAPDPVGRGGWPCPWRPLLSHE